ncbi:hypothetical protein [Clostridium akagii]|uniref:hypothetical protein n=1 Tax=Clostridium akagii TaxID=91623 RepID=UPI00047AF991|nr:hypothetical protein [Clostridium akagii]
MKAFIALKLLDRFKGIFNKMGIDYHVMRRIVQIKLTMDGRRVPTIMNSSSKRKRNEGNKDKNLFKTSLLVYFIIGIVFLPFILMGTNYIFQMSFVFGILIFLLMTTLISDFSSVFLDIRDKNIIFSKPVKNITLSGAKFVHILIYMISITFSLSALGLIASLIRHGVLFFLIFLIEIIFIDIFVVVLSALIYLFILRFFDGEKLKDIINYVQIILTITITIGYQFIGRIFNIVGYNVVYVPKWWQYFIIPMWFSAPFELINNGSTKIYFVILTALAIVIPIIAIIIYIKLLPTFEKNLQKLNNNYSQNKNQNYKFTNGISNLICSTKVEKTFFRFCLDMMKNERNFKLKVYPSLGFSIVLPFIFLFSYIRDEGFSTMASSKLYFTIYFCALMLPSVIMMIKYSEKYKGAWIYKVAPLAETSDIYKGTFKALIVKLILPIYFLECMIFTAIFGIRIIPDLILIFLIMLIYVVVCFSLFKKALPFSEAYGTGGQGEGMIIIPMMIILGVMALIHFFVTTIQYGVFIYIIIALLVNIFAWKKAFKIVL